MRKQGLRVLRIGLVVLLLLATTIQAVRADLTHTVRAGETLSSIGLRYGVSANAIAAANGLANPNYIYVGQVLTIPSGGGSGGYTPPYNPGGGSPGPSHTPSGGGSQWPRRDVPWGPCRPSGTLAVTAWVSDPNPAQGAMVTVYGKLTRGGAGVRGAQMSSNWYYQWYTSWCSGVSGWDGTASCSLLIGQPTPGYYVRVRVAFYYQGQWYYAETGFTPR